MAKGSHVQGRLVMSPLRSVGFVVALSFLLSGCAQFAEVTGLDPAIVDGDEVQVTAVEEAAPIVEEYPTPVAAPVDVAAYEVWGEPTVMPVALQGPQAVADTDGPYLLDTGDRLRVFVYGQPNLSRQYTVDHGGKITIPLIGAVTTRAKTTAQLEGAIRSMLGTQYVRDPQVTVDVQQNRPFFILGEVKSAGQYPYVSGMTVETAIAIAGGYSERASDRMFRITRRINGYVEQIEAPSDYVVKPGDTVTVFERFF